MAKDKKTVTVAAKTTKAKNSVRSVSRKIVQALRAERNHENRFNAALLLDERVSRVDTKVAKKQRLTAIEQVWDKKFSVEREAESLFDRYSDRGVTYAACVQAVKTGKVADRVAMWANRPVIG